MIDYTKIWLPEIVGGGYSEFWNFTGRYRVVKGSRASKKSKTAALNLIFRLIKYPLANLLVVRKTYSTLKDSCFTELCWAIKTFQISHLWEIKHSPLEITFIPTGQKIFFRGLDDPLKITSISTNYGYLCWLWIEEAYELSSINDFDILQESIRGAVPDGYFKQVTLTFNPWSEHHWLKKRFFDCPNDDDDDGGDSDILAITTNYLNNEWLDQQDLKLFMDMKKNNPTRYKTAGLGEWGISEGLIFNNWSIKDFDYQQVASTQNVKSIFGLDFGYSNDPTALFCGLIDIDNKQIFVFDELYKRALTNSDIYTHICTLGYQKERIKADSSEPKSIDELRALGLQNISRARKGKDSVLNGIQFIQGFQIIINPRCTNFICEVSNYHWNKTTDGVSINTPCDKFNHLLDAMRYATEEFILGEKFSFN